MKKSGEGLHILWEIISKGIEYRWEQFKDWAFSPNPCPKHGMKYLYQHGYEDQWACYRCQKKRHNDWIGKREDYLK